MSTTPANPTCLFCQGAGPFRSESHIVPESLGGAAAPVALKGTTCDPCNQYFGQKVESAALSSFPFGAYRLFSAVPSKKGRMHAHRTTLGLASATGVPGRLNIEPSNDETRRQLLESQTGQVRILAEVTEPLAVCRMLLKVGLEALAKHEGELARSPRFQAAREFCRRPKRGDRWWFCLRSDPSEMLTRLMTQDDDSCEIEVREVQGVACGILRFAGLATLVPLEPNATPPEFSNEDNNNRVTWAIC